MFHEYYTVLASVQLFMHVSSTGYVSGVIIRELWLGEGGLLMTCIWHTVHTRHESSAADRYCIPALNQMRPSQHFVSLTCCHLLQVLGGM